MRRFARLRMGGLRRAHSAGAPVTGEVVRERPSDVHEDHLSARGVGHPARRPEPHQHGEWGPAFISVRTSNGTSATRSPSSASPLAGSRAPPSRRLCITGQPVRSSRQVIRAAMKVAVAATGGLKVFGATRRRSNETASSRLSPGRAGPRQRPCMSRRGSGSPRHPGRPNLPPVTSPPPGHFRGAVAEARHRPPSPSAQLLPGPDGRVRPGLERGDGRLPAGGVGHRSTVLPPMSATAQAVGTSP